MTLIMILFSGGEKQRVAIARTLLKSFIYTQIFSPKKIVFSFFRGQKESKIIFCKKAIMQVFKKKKIEF